jgi:hypothetical protein
MDFKSLPKSFGLRSEARGMEDSVHSSDALNSQFFGQEPTICSEPVLLSSSAFFYNLTHSLSFTFLKRGKIWSNNLIWQE